MKQRSFAIIAGLLALLGIALYLATPPALVNAAVAPRLPDDLDAHLAANERQVAEIHALIPDTGKRITWRQPGVRTDYAIVYLHGFSATRHETAPLAQRIAAALGANLFETRLSGHGHTERPMHAVRAEDWLEDGAEALAIGARLGDKVIVIGTSTGATLALAMSNDAVAQMVSDLILISPNLQPQDGKSNWLTRPAGPLLAWLITGDTRSWTAHNDQQARYWSTSYPTEAVVEVMRLVDFAQSRLPMRVTQNVLILLSPEDKVVSPDATRVAFGRIESPHKRLIEIETQDPSNHVLAGDILSPGTTDDVAATIINFIQPAEVQKL